MFRSWVVLASCFVLLACQTKPTRMRESSELNPQFLMKRLEGPIQLSENTRVIDARGTFEYSVAHMPGALNLSWEDFAEPSGKARGRVANDLGALAKRLALLGLEPQSEVVVVGLGPKGHGEEGRVAWSLMHLGFVNVQVASLDHFKVGMNNAEPPPRPNAKAWEPKLRPELEALMPEVQAVAFQALKEGERKSAYLLDVRTRKEYFQKGGLGEGYVTPDLGALHVPWTEFFDSAGRPNRNVRNQLLALGWRANDRVIVLSDHGVRSGAVAFALMNLGFTNVANYTGGYSELMASASKKSPKLRPLGK